MSDRERWIVYPLLFLALGAALRDKLAKKSYSEDLFCKTLTVFDEQDRPVAQLNGGDLVVNRIEAKQINAANLRPAAAPAGGGFGLGQFLEMFQRAGGTVRIRPPQATPGKNPQPPPKNDSAESPDLPDQPAGDPAGEP